MTWTKCNTLHVIHKYSLRYAQSDFERGVGYKTTSNTKERDGRCAAIYMYTKYWNSRICFIGVRVAFSHMEKIN